MRRNLLAAAILARAGLSIATAPAAAAKKPNQECHYEYR